MRRLFLIATLLLTACSSAPSPTPTASQTPPSSSASAPTPSPSGPTVTCEPAADSIGTDASGSPIPALLLTCEKAVAAAEAVVGSDPGIASVEFHYGYWCPPGEYCPFIITNTHDAGHVIFHLTGLRPDILVEVHVGAGLVIASSPQPLPSPSS